ncbi:MAG TPA: LuxR C-terminal-related transcriptional regulator [Ktedonobacteraceae bacterium]
MATSHRCLSWRADRQLYELDEQGRKQFFPLTGDEEQWVAWLESISAFSFEGQQGHLTIRKEARSRGEQYWYAYRRVGSRMMKKYLGRSTTLTLARLEEMAAAFPPVAPSSLPGDGQRMHQEEAGGEEQTTVKTDAPPVLLAQARMPGDPLLATRLHQPRPRGHLISRPHLTLRLQQGMERALTLVSAPAGFGKTTLLTQWLAEHETPATWLTLEVEDNEPVRFFSYLLAALQILSPQLGKLARALLEASPSILLERVLTLLINDILGSVPGNFALVLDDYHVIENDAIHRGMGFLLEHLPPQMHLILATRVDPPLPLTRLRARGQLIEVRTADLRFDSGQAYAFLHTVMGLDLPDEAVATLERRVEGWIAGLQLAALSLQGRSDVSAFLNAFTGSHRFVFDYLTEEVFVRQPAPIQSFLLATSILERLCDPLCDAVTDQKERQARLAVLEQANLFVVALDDERHWYRYHHLFAEALRARLQQTNPALVPHLHLRASRWYEQQGLFAEAVQHAFAAADIERAADLIESIDVDSWAGIGPAVQRVLGWLARLPEPVVRVRPLLCIVHAIALMFTHQPQEAEARLHMAERCLDEQTPSEQVNFLRGHITSTRAVMARFSGELARSVMLAQQALALLPYPERTPGPISRLNVAQAFLVSGEVTTVQERFAREMVISLQASENESMTMRSLTNLAQLQMLQGRLRQAAATFEQAARAVPQQEKMQAIMGSPVYSCGLAEILREWNELEQAECLLDQGMELIEAGLPAEGEVVALGYITHARLLMARFEYDRALAALGTFTRLAREHSFAPHLITRGEAWRAHIQLAQGNLKAALSWAEQCGLKVSDDEITYIRERAYLTLARVLIVQGRDNSSPSLLQNAFSLLGRLLQEAEAKARGSSVLEILLLQSLSLTALGDRGAAFPLFSHALSLAEPEGYIRLFVDEGAAMRNLLREARSRRIVLHAVARLLAAFGEPVEGSQDGSSSPAGALVEPLTRREHEVLQLLARGASNREIASHLVVSTGTVKKYVYAICGKLGVQSRTQALARARTLHLL